MAYIHEGRELLTIEMSKGFVNFLVIVFGCVSAAFWTERNQSNITAAPSVKISAPAVITATDDT